MRVVREVGAGEADDEHCVRRKQASERSLEPCRTPQHALTKRIDHRVVAIDRAVHFDNGIAASSAPFASRSNSSGEQKTECSMWFAWQASSIKRSKFVVMTARRTPLRAIAASAAWLSFQASMSSGWKSRK